MTPTIGRIVIFHTTKQDQATMQVNNTSGCSNIREELPAMIVGINKSGDAIISINLKVELDGHGQLWKKSVVEGNEEGQYSWPVIAK